MKVAFVLDLYVKYFLCKCNSCHDSESLVMIRKCKSFCFDSEKRPRMSTFFQEITLLQVTAEQIIVLS